MNGADLRRLLERVRAGEVSPDDAAEALRTLPFEGVADGLARVDHHRPLRAGAPEVVLGEWKTADAIAEILASLAQGGRGALATRVSAQKADRVRERLAEARYDEASRTLVVPAPEPARAPGRIAVIAAGTSDAPVAAEVVATAEFLGHAVDRIDDVGVAGLPRVLHASERARDADVAVVVAGMEGALPSVLAGLLAAPIVAVPTSVGYGVGAGGLAALSSMLASCAPGVAVVNIDNGFGAAVAASRMCRIGEPPSRVPGDDAAVGSGPSEASAKTRGAGARGSAREDGENAPDSHDP